MNTINIYVPGSFKAYTARNNEAPEVQKGCFNFKKCIH
jgi:hypothetical protein